MLPGYWADWRVDPYTFFTCAPKSACLGKTNADNATCAAGYEGRACSNCLSLKYYRLQVRMEPRLLRGEPFVLESRCCAWLPTHWS